MAISLQPEAKFHQMDCRRIDTAGQKITVCAVFFLFIFSSVYMAKLDDPNGKGFSRSAFVKTIEDYREELKKGGAKPLSSVEIGMSKYYSDLSNTVLGTNVGVAPGIGPVQP